MLTHALSAASPMPLASGKSDALPSTAATPTVERSPISPQEAIMAANKTMRALSNGLEFSVDPDSKKVVVRLVDGETKQVIRQFPSEELQSIARSIDRMQGLLLNHKA